MVALGFAGSERSTRYAIDEVHAAWRIDHVRVHRAWDTEPGLWFQVEFGDGPVIDGRKTVLFVAWLAWSRLRTVSALRDRTAPSVFAALAINIFDPERILLGGLLGTIFTLLRIVFRSKSGL